MMPRIDVGVSMVGTFRNEVDGVSHSTKLTLLVSCFDMVSVVDDAICIGEHSNAGWPRV